jgi:hypothetical protein
MKNFDKHLVSILLFLCAAVSIPVCAHHSFGMFDASDEAEILVEGVIKRWQFVNPHSWLIVTVSNQDGSATDWSFEASSVPNLVRLGVTKETFRQGEKVRVIAAPMRDGRPAGGLKLVRHEDGSYTFPNDPGVGRRDAAERWQAELEK